MGRPRRIDLNRPRSVVRIVGTTLSMYFRFPFLFLTLALVVVVPYELLWMLATSGSVFDRGNRWTSYLDRFVGLPFAIALISALHAYAVAMIGEGETPHLLEVARRGVRVLPPVAVAEVVVTIGIGLPFLLAETAREIWYPHSIDAWFVPELVLAIPAIFLAARWAVVAQAVAIERLRWRAALARSARFAAHHYRHVAGLVVLMWFVEAAISIAVFAWITRHYGFRRDNVPASIMLIGSQTIIWSLTALTSAILYFDLRARFESASLNDGPNSS